MLTLVIFTFKRIDRLNTCLKSVDSKNVDEILIFNDDESEALNVNKLKLDSNFIKVFNPSDWDFSGRQFRKPIYLNKAIEIAKNEKILFSDDDGNFNKGAIDLHYNALDKFRFTAGAVIRDRILNRISKSILQGTNYAFQKSFFSELGGYDEAYCDSMGGGDVDFWYRIYSHSRLQNIPVAFLPNAIQKVTAKSSRKKITRELDPKNYTLKKHGLNLDGPMYKWFPEIRDKQKWMTIING
ncbi:MAG: hypothetical protein HOM61_01840 [Candidatus Marinimicrobia bacterium]|nr:hypothetical protein [Candidatus Neomarinimicrobiota bacterium]